MAREDDEQQAMSEARLAAIREQIEEAAAYAAEMPDPEWAYNCYMVGSTLLAEVERLRAVLTAQEEREAALRDAVARAVASTGVGRDRSSGAWFVFVGDVDAETLREQARVLLASADSERSGGDGA